MTPLDLALILACIASWTLLIAFTAHERRRALELHDYRIAVHAEVAFLRAALYAVSMENERLRERIADEDDAGEQWKRAT